jgi:5-methylcytosine-specific restriction endonuclease McrA
VPAKAQKPCKTAGCSGLTRRIFCPRCELAGKTKEARPNSYQRGYDKEWFGYRNWFLSVHRFCADPFKRHLIPEVATVVDHIQPHKGDVILFWNKDNHQALCKSCHDFKTATRDGGFGRVREKPILSNPPKLLISK